MKTLQLENATSLAHIERPPMLIQDIIPEASLSFVAGANYCGKTFFAMELARAVAFGEPFMGRWPVERQGNVLFIEQDSPKYDTGRAFYALIRHQYDSLLAGTDGSHPLQALQFAWMPDLDLTQGDDVKAIIHTAKHLHTPMGFTPTQEEIAFNGCALIILDTFRSLSTADENSSTEIQAIISRLKIVRDQTGAAICVLHHTGHNDKLRGSTAIGGAVDNLYLITKRKREGVSRVVVEKARAIQPPDFTYRISTTHDHTLGMTKAVRFVELLNQSEDAIPAPTEETFRAHLLAHPGTTRPELEDWGALNNVTYGTIGKWLIALREARMVREEFPSGRIYLLDTPPSAA
jgi:hypothetical protein